MKDYQDIYHIQSVNINPFDKEIYVNGTDGIQFHPFIHKKERLSVFIP